MVTKTSRSFPMCSVIVLNHNGKKHLKLCLDSLKKQTYLKYEVIVVDNASRDGSVNFIKRNHSWVRLIKSKTNLGYAGGNNLGIENARGEYIVILNNDTVVDKDWLKELVRVAKGSKKIGIVGGKVYYFDYPNKIQSIGGRLHEWNSFILLGSRIGKNQEDRGQYEKVGEMDYALGCAFLVKKDVLNRIGLFDEKYFIYNEEIELAYRAKKAGYKIVYAPNAKIWHHGSVVVKRETYKKVYLTQRNKIRFILKNFDLHLIIWNVFSQGFHFALKIGLSLIKGNSINTVKGIFDAIKWNLVNLKDTVRARKTN